MQTNEKAGVSRRWRTIALIALGVALGTTLTATPVYSHVGGTVSHLWTEHIRPLTDARYHTKAGSDARYVNVGEKASNADKLDGIDSTGFYRAGTKVADADKLDGIDSTGFYAAGSKVADSDMLDGIDSMGFYAAGSKVADSDLLDGQDSSAFQRSCQPGAILGYAYLDAATTNAGTSIVKSFNCFGESVVAERTDTGRYRIEFRLGQFSGVRDRDKVVVLATARDPDCSADCNDFVVVSSTSPIQSVDGIGVDVVVRDRAGGRTDTDFMIMLLR